MKGLSSRKFALTHEWVQVENGVATIGITRFGREQLGEIVYIQLPPVGEKVARNDPVSVLESNKAAADLYAVVSGKILSINQEALPHLNRDADQTWLFKMQLDDPLELDSLYDLAAYQKTIS